jgi:hypothetical protein
LHVEIRTGVTSGNDFYGDFSLIRQYDRSV